MDIQEYVELRFGADAARKLEHIRVGGDNNRKGSTYEGFFAVARMIGIAASAADLDDYVFSAQELAFVDDLCVKQLSSLTKTNYQAKNSSGQHADWTQDIEQRFAWQRQIDRDVHEFPNSFQVLLVSCPDKAASNQRKIPTAAQAWCRSEYFPYHVATPQLILSHEHLRNDLQTLCQSRELSLADSAFRIVLGAWHSDQAPKTLKQIFLRAREMSKPDLFAGLFMPAETLPKWLTTKCAQFPGVTASLERGRYIVSYRGLTVTSPAGTDTPDPNLLGRLSTLQEFLTFLMSQAIAEINH